MLLLPILALSLLLIGGTGQKTEAPKDLEEKTAELCSQVSGVGECRVMITYRDDEVFAVAVLCDGADNIEVKHNLTSLISSLYGIGAHRVEILSLE
ncbi:MAG: hypothetical protein IKU99_00510 [Clostridia bacterium]|nr:hypothetical protein [Clostridia bacterium]